MSFGKSNKTAHRHRPKKVVEVDEDELREKREEQLNTQRIPMIVTLVGSLAMLGIIVMGAPYSYGSQKIHYSGGNISQAKELLKLDKKERADADPKLLIDFTSIVIPPTRAPSEAMKAVAQTCRQGRAASLVSIPPDKAHDAFNKATKYLTCVMATDPARFCSATERKILVDQLMDYKEKRQNVLAYEKYRDKAIIAHESYRDLKRNQGAKVPPPLEISKATLPEEIDGGLSRQLQNLVSNGYISAKDFGYRGFYVPEEYQTALSGGADRFAPCTRT